MKALNKKKILLLAGVIFIGALVIFNFLSVPENTTNRLKHFKTNKEYISHYNLNFKNIQYNHWNFKSGDYSIFTQSFIPAKRKGIVLILHGYLSHSGVLGDITSLVLKEGYGVILYDLPGHGLSNGESGDCASFHEYGTCLNDFVNNYKKRYNDKLYFIGHSTGCASFIDYSLRYNASFVRVLFAAPLIRYYLWHPTIIAQRIGEQFIKSIKRVVQNSTTNKKHIDFITHNDPLQAKRLPLHWVTALREWNKWLDEKNKMISIPVKILQGTGDKVVDIDYNMKKIKDFYPSSSVILLKGLRHDLFNEAGKNRDLVHKHIKEFLK